MRRRAAAAADDDEVIIRRKEEEEEESGCGKEEEGEGKKKRKKKKKKRGRVVGSLWRILITPSGVFCLTPNNQQQQRSSINHADHLHVKTGEKASRLLDNTSPRSPLSPNAPHMDTADFQSAKETGVETCVDTSIEKLYDNVCEMQSSGEQSPAGQSFASDDNESRIDSELRHLVGGEELDDTCHSDQIENGVDPEGRYENEGVGESGKNGAATKKISPKKTMKKQKPKPGWSSSTKVVHPKLPPSINVDVSPPPKPPTLKSKPVPAKTPKSQENGSTIIENAEKPGDEQHASSEEKEPSPNKSSTKNGNGFLAPIKKPKPPTVASARSQVGTEDPSELGLDNPDLGPFLLKMSRDLVVSGDNPLKALELASRAAKSFEVCADGKPSLDLVMSLHVVAAIHCNLGDYGKAIPVLEHSIEIPVLEEGQDHALAAFSGYMQLGDTYAMVGQLEQSIECYTMGLQIQKGVIGESDPRVAETCRYLAEAHMQALQFNEAKTLCQLALHIHREQGAPASLEEAADRRLMGLICDTVGDYEAALEHLVLASMAMVANGQENEVAVVDCSIGDIYLSMNRYDEAVFAYQKALTVYKTTKGENHPSVGSVFVRLADLYNKTGRLRESKSYCENALRIYGKAVPGSSVEEIASGLTEVSAIYEAMNEPEEAIKLLQKALKILNDTPGQQGAVAGIEAQMGVLYYVTGNYAGSYSSLKSAIAKLRAYGEKRNAFFGVVLNQMGLACVQLYSIKEAVDLFEEARAILELEYGPYHPDTLCVYSNLAATYDAMGRVEEAIEVLEYVLGIREEKLGTANPDVDDEKKRLAELLKEAGKVRSRKSKSLETLLDCTTQIIRSEPLHHVSPPSIKA